MAPKKSFSTKDLDDEDGICPGYIRGNIQNEMNRIKENKKQPTNEEVVFLESLHSNAVISFYFSVSRQLWV